VGAGVATVGVAASIGIGTVARAQAPSEANIRAGRRIYTQKADCQACHGWAGDGQKMDYQSPDGANLRVSTLDRDQLVFVIKCGLPGRDMPAFDRLSYTDDRCLGRTRADLDRMGLKLPDPAATLQAREVERLADFLFAKVVGQGEMDRAKCVDFWGEEVDVCSEL
jgi:mono/diheme cytochrome c family protein